jgi:hypothetical protein
MSPERTDEVLSDFFKSQMPKTWPAAPRSAEPASLLAARAARSQSTRARLTLAASVAVLLGACWLFSGGSRPADHGKPASTPGLLQDGSAKMPKEFTRPKPPADPMLN